jgi:hypothetical protein
MPLVTRQDYAITGYGTNDFNRDYMDYAAFRNALVKMRENAPLFLRELHNQASVAWTRRLDKRSAVQRS